jgi:formamidase
MKAVVVSQAVRIDRSLPLSAEPHTGHNRWHPDVAPILKVAQGEIIEIETRDACDGQIGRTPKPNEIASLDGKRTHPLTGPVFVEGAEPGDLLEIEVLAVEPQDFGFTTCSPRYGIIKKHLTSVLVARWSIRDGFATSDDIPGVRIPAAPFMGFMGVAPSHELMEQYRAYDLRLNQAGVGPVPQEPIGAIPPTAGNGLRTIPPRDHGGNLDIKQLTAGSVLRLPVYVPGALFSTGDAHFAQGDNECCTGIEIGATLRCRFGVIKNAARDRGIQDAQVYRAVPGAENRSSPIFCTTGQSFARDGSLNFDDLNRAAEHALMNMIDHMRHEYGFSTEQAAIICSVAVDLKISQAANNPNYLVTAVLPLDIFI